MIGVVVVASLASCSTQTPGQAVPGAQAGSTGTPGTGTRTSSRPTSNRPPADSPLHDTDPCSLLDSAGQAKLGINTPGEPHNIVNSRGCRWRMRVGSDTTVFDVGILDNQRIDQIPSNVQVEKIPNVGQHQAVRAKDVAGARNCAVILGVGDKSRVDNNVVAGNDVEKACELVMELARLVEPKLP